MMETLSLLFNLLNLLVCDTGKSPSASCSLFNAVAARD